MLSYTIICRRHSQSIPLFAPRMHTIAPSQIHPPLPQSQGSNSYRNIPHINPVQPLSAYNPTQYAHSYILPISNDYTDQNEFMDDSEVEQKSFAYNHLIMMRWT